jgi:hypothetical protein
LSDRFGIRARSLTILVPGTSAGTAVVVLAFSSGGYFPSDHGLLLLAFALVALTAVLVCDELVVDRRSLALAGGLAALALWSLASWAWAPAAAWPVLEAERGLVYAAASVALVVVATPARTTSLLAGVALGTTVVAAYALTTRLFPGGRGGAYDPAGGYQLVAPLGYSNALGLLLATGLLLALGLALRREPVLRVPAGAALVVLATALYFTYSRGAIGALIVGLAVLLALERGAWSRAPLLAVAPAAAVVLASRSPALTGAGLPLASAQEQGERLARELVALAGVGAGLAWVLPLVAIELRVPLAGRTARVVAAAAAATAGLVLVAATAGPVTLARSAVDAFRDEPGETSGDLDRRLLSVSGHGRADYWRVAARMVEREPLLGDGAGTFERRWMEERDVPHDARDAHTLYLETLAELGPVGLGLLLVALGAPLTAVRRTPGAPLTAAAAAAYVAFLAHAALDWDWEVPLLVLCALACAATLVVSSRPTTPLELTPLVRTLGATAAIAVVAVALVAHVGNRAVAASASALERGDVEAAAEAARRARAWAPWSHEPLRLAGEAHLAAGELPAARRSLREAARRAPEEWRVWLDLALVSNGADAGYAITRTRELNPLGPEVRALEHR